MPILISTAEILTPNARKYVQQLGKHWSHRFPVTVGDQSTKVEFSDATHVVLTPASDYVRAEITTSDDQGLERLQGVVFEHIERFAHRETLTMPAWRTGAEAG